MLFELTNQPRKCRSDAIIVGILSEKAPIQLSAKLFILQVYGVLARHTALCFFYISVTVFHDSSRCVW